MIRIHEEYLTREGAERARQSLLETYHPLGYGTTLHVHRDRLTQHWVLSGHRFASCD